MLWNDPRAQVQLALIFLLINVFLLAGCGTTVKEVDVEVTSHIEIVCGSPPPLDRLKMYPWEPTVHVNDDGSVTITMTVKEYENMSRNMANIKRRFKQDAAVIQFYRECIEDFNADQEPSAHSGAQILRASLQG